MLALFSPIVGSLKRKTIFYEESNDRIRRFIFCCYYRR